MSVHLPKLVSLLEVVCRRIGLLELQPGPSSVWMMQLLRDGRGNWWRWGYLREVPFDWRHCRACVVLAIMILQPFVNILGSQAELGM